MEYKLVCIDIDGTLLNSQHKVSDYTKEVLRKAHEKGVHIVISTGRMYTDAEYYSNLVGVKSPIIASNGAVIKEKGSNEVIYKSILGESVCLKIVEMLSTHRVGPCFYTPETMYCGNLLMQFFLFLGKLKGIIGQDIQIKYVFSKKQWKKIFHKEKDNIVKCEIIHKNPEKLMSLRKELSRIKEIEMVSSSNHNIEVTWKGVSKGRAVKVLAGRYQLKKEEIITIGDSENDLSMIEYAGLGIAMGNATEKVKEKAGYITATNDEEGVAKAIEKFVLQGL